MSALCIPLSTISVDGIEAAQRLTGDSFYVDAFNGLMAYEICRHFRIIHCKGYGADTLEALRGNLNSNITPEGVRYAAVSSEEVRSLAARFNADLVIVPYTCTIAQKEVKLKGWRDDKFGAYYEKPTTFHVHARFHLQVWDCEGSLLYECVGSGSTERPVQYTFKSGSDTENRTMRFHAPPIVRTLHDAIKTTFQFDIPSGGSRPGPRRGVHYDREGS